MSIEKIFFSVPAPNGKTEWTKLITLDDKSKEWYTLNHDTKGWELFLAEPAPTIATGLTGSYQIIGNQSLNFTDGVLTSVT